MHLCNSVTHRSPLLSLLCRDLSSNRLTGMRCSCSSYGGPCLSAKQHGGQRKLGSRNAPAATFACPSGPLQAHSLTAGPPAAAHSPSCRSCERRQGGRGNVRRGRACKRWARARGAAPAGVLSTLGLPRRTPAHHACFLACFLPTARSHLERNRLNGTLPLGWAAPTSPFPLALQTIALASNALTGPLPAEWSSLTFLSLL